MYNLVVQQFLLFNKSIMCLCCRQENIMIVRGRKILLHKVPFIHCPPLDLFPCFAQSKTFCYCSQVVPIFFNLNLSCRISYRRTSFSILITNTSSVNQALELVLTINWSTMVSYETIFQILSTFQMGAVCFFSCVNDATIFILCALPCATVHVGICYPWTPHVSSIL